MQEEYHSKMKNRVRINVTLNFNLYLTLSKRANKVGVTKSTILRDWIRDTKFITLYPQEKSNKQETISYSFYVQYPLAEKIDNIKKTYGLSKSLTVRLIIQSKC